MRLSTVVWAVVAIAITQSDPRRAPSSPEGIPFVAAYNARDFGQPGIQRVSVELRSGSHVTRRFTIVNAWHADTAAVNSVYWLEAPATLAGTAYLQSEIAAESADFSVRLFLPSGQRRVLTVPPEEHGQGLLGSDFTYEDLRRRLPLQGYTYRVAGYAVISGESAIVLDVIRSSGSWTLGRLTIASDTRFLLAADYFRSPTDARPFKRMRVDRWRTTTGMRSAEQMTMTAGDGRSTVITLLDAKFHVPAFPAGALAEHRLSDAGHALAGLLAR